MARPFAKTKDRDIVMPIIDKLMKVPRAVHTYHYDIEIPAHYMPAKADILELAKPKGIGKDYLNDVLSALERSGRIESKKNGPTKHYIPCGWLSKAKLSDESRTNEKKETDLEIFLRDRKNKRIVRAITTIAEKKIKRHKDDSLKSDQESGIPNEYFISISEIKTMLDANRHEKKMSPAVIRAKIDRMESEVFLVKSRKISGKRCVFFVKPPRRLSRLL